MRCYPTYQSQQVICYQAIFGMPEIYRPKTLDDGHKEVHGGDETELQPESKDEELKVEAKSEKIHLKPTVSKEMVELTYRIAKRFTHSLPPNIRDEIEADAILGLIDAAAKFDPSRGVPFEAYARMRIKGEMLDGLRRADPLTRIQRREVKENKRRKLEDPSFEPPTDAQINPETVDIASLPGLASDKFNPEEEVDRKRKLQMIEAALDALPDRLFNIFFLYTFEDLTLDEIGQQLGVTQSRVSQLYKQAIRFLRNELRVPSEYME